MSTLTKPYTFTADTYAVAQQVNSDFDTLYNWVNGGGAMWNDGSVAFTAVPSGPNVDPSAPNHLTRKAYVDNNAVRNANGGLILVQGGWASITTDANGNFTYTYPSAFPNTAFNVIATIGSTTQGANMSVILENTQMTKTNIVGRVILPASNSGLASTTIRIFFLAMGT